MRNRNILYCDTMAATLGEKMEKAYKRYGVNISIKNWDCDSDRFIFFVELKGATTERHVRKHAPDVQQRLRLVQFYVDKQNLAICFVVVIQKVDYQHLPDILNSQENKEMQLPYIVGHDVLGELVTVDLEQFPHLLIAGATNSGKTVGLQSLIISIIYEKSPQQVNLILIDVGATDLIQFNGIPHLSCPVVREGESACQVLISLMNEMERRIKLSVSNPNQFEQLPSLVVVVDEFSAVFIGREDRHIIKRVRDAVSSLLQRGRHAKIHVVLAAQNPTIQNMKVDIGNITARIAFRCAKKNFSETIIGESGAENLSGKGDMYFKYPQYEGRRRIQGIYVSPEELPEILSTVKDRWKRLYYETKYKFIINASDLQKIEADIVDKSTGKFLTGKTNIENYMFARILLWAWEQDTISCNMLMRQFNIGWKRADNFMAKLNAIGVVEDLDSKLPRRVLKHSAKDFSEEQITFLQHQGVFLEEITDVSGNDD